MFYPSVHSAHLAAAPAAIPSFIKNQVQVGRKDGFWVEAFPFRASDKTGHNIIGYGCGAEGTSSKVEMFINPFRENKTSTWTSRLLTELVNPFAMSYADISGHGFNDVIMSDRQNESKDKKTARISWLENTGDPSHENWTRRTIGSPEYLLKGGHFTRKDRIQVCAVPFITSNTTTEVPVLIFTAPDDPKGTSDWHEEKVMDKGPVHEIVIIPSESGLDRILLAGHNFIELIWLEDKTWKSFKVADRDTGSVACAHVRDDYAGYIAASEAFRGNVVSVYTKPANSAKGIVDNKWTRHVLDDFGSLKDKQTGSIYQVVCADIDGDGVDEILVAMVGSDPPSYNRTGVWCYKPINFEKGRFSKVKLSYDSAGRISIADFLSNSRLDFATISYSVPDGFKAPSPSINIFLSTGITAEKLNNEICFRVVRPASTRLVSEVEFLDVAARKLTLVVLPPKVLYTIPSGSAVKVIAGTLTWTDKGTGDYTERSLAPSPCKCLSMSVNADHIRSKEGAVFILLKSKTARNQTLPYTSISQLVAHNILPLQFADEVRAMEFPWVKVEDRSWAHGRFKRDSAFYNLVGFHVRYADDSDDVLAHIQMWAAGVGVSTGFHNHVENPLCEIRACIINGTGKGGMYWATVADDKFNVDSPNSLDMKSVVVPALHEHGPIWRIGRYGFPALRQNGTVDYPWHAWMAGKKYPFLAEPMAGNNVFIPPKPPYDVWITFEFPPFVTHCDPTPLPNPSSSKTLRLLETTGSYIISQTSTGDVVGLSNAADNAPVEAYPPSTVDQKWTLLSVAGTDLHQLMHIATRSLMAVRWPPGHGQQVVGTHTLANGAMLSSWAMSVADSSKKAYSFRLAVTSGGLALDIDRNGGSTVVFEEIDVEDIKIVKGNIEFEVEVDRIVRISEQPVISHQPARLFVRQSDVDLEPPSFILKAVAT